MIDSLVLRVGTTRGSEVVLIGKRTCDACGSGVFTKSFEASENCCRAYITCSSCQRRVSVGVMEVDAVVS